MIATECEKSNLTPEEQAIFDALRNPDEPGDNHFDNTELEVLVLAGMMAIDDCVLPNLVRPRMFQVREHELIASIIFDHFRQFGARPSQTVIKSEIRERTADHATQQYYLGALAKIAANVTPMIESRSWLVDKVTNFAYRDARIRALDEVLDLLTKDPALDGVAQFRALADKLEQIKTTTVERPGMTALDLWNYKSDKTELLPNMLLSATHTLLSAREKRGKSYWMVNMIADWLGSGYVADLPVKPVPIVYLDFEMGIEMFRPFYFGKLFPAPGTPAFETLNKCFSYRDRSMLPAYVSADWLGNLVKPFAHPGVIVIDTIRAAFSGDPKVSKIDAWENNAGTVGSVLRPITEFCHSSGWNVVSVHHNNKSDNYSGSTEFGAAVDATWTFSSPGGEESNERLLRVVGRGLAGNFKFDFDSGRYQYAPPVGNATVREWIVAQHRRTPETPITQAELITARPAGFSEAMVRNAHRTMRDACEFVKHAGRKGGGGFTLA